MLAAAVLACAATSVLVDVGGGAGSAQAAAAGLGAPGAPSVTVSGASATLSWAEANAPGAGTVADRVERLDTSGSLWTDACGTSDSAPITALACTERPATETSCGA